MNGRRAAVLLLVPVTLAASCARSTPQPPTPPARDLVVLAPDPESGAVGRLVVSTPDGSVTLAEARASTTVTAGAAPSAPTVLDADTVARIFGDALSVQPAAPRRFQLYFEIGGDTLTPESRALVGEVIAAVRGWVAPEVSVIGHTDTTGTAASNLTLGLRRAELLRSLLVDAGLDPSLVDALSHGEGDLLVPPRTTSPGRNRRVRVTIGSP